MQLIFSFLVPNKMRNVISCWPDEFEFVKQILQTNFIRKKLKTHFIFLQNCFNKSIICSQDLLFKQNKL